MEGNDLSQNPLFHGSQERKQNGKNQSDWGARGKGLKFCLYCLKLLDLETLN